jgi:hypothetical protein
VIDLRSDTVAKPTLPVRLYLRHKLWQKAYADAEVDHARLQSQSD